jgi:hypothetical protein
VRFLRNRLLWRLRIPPLAEVTILRPMSIRPRVAIFLVSASGLLGTAAAYAQDTDVAVTTGGSSSTSTASSETGGDATQGGTAAAATGGSSSKSTSSSASETGGEGSNGGGTKVAPFDENQVNCECRLASTGLAHSHAAGWVLLGALGLLARRRTPRRPKSLSQ